MDQLKNLLRPDREQLMPRQNVLAQIDARAGDQVADVGAGLGWLTFPLADVVGPQGQVYAIDPSHDAIQTLEDRARREGFSQVTPIEAFAERTPLSDAAVDRIVWHTMYHDVNDRPRALQEMRRILAPHGRWIIVDWEKTPMEVGPPMDIRMSPQEVAAEVEAAGFRVLSHWKAGPVTWGLTVAKA
jgi:ubiquinone/menaquinone biosynthesis C-methylase UbiE